MERSKSSNLGEQQAEGNLGNERVRNSSSDESFGSSSRNRRNRDSSPGEEPWSSSSDSPESCEDERTDGSER